MAKFTVLSMPRFFTDTPIKQKQSQLIRSTAITK